MDARPIPKERWFAATMRVNDGVGEGGIFAQEGIVGGAVVVVLVASLDP